MQRVRGEDIWKRERCGGRKEGHINNGVDGLCATNPMDRDRNICSNLLLYEIQAGTVH